MEHRSLPSSGDLEVSSAQGDQSSFKSFRASRFARKVELSSWFPKLQDSQNDNNSTDATTQRSKEGLWTSQRSRALLVQITVVGTILIVNIALTAVATARFALQNGVGVIYEGDCTTVAKLDQWLHLLINLMSTGMLSASNYCMQLQAAPTRANIDNAHRQGKWLDIGVPSLRNFAYIGNWRRFSWLLLAFSSVPIHMIYNSAVFQSLTSYDYTVAVVKDSFLEGAHWSTALADPRRGIDPGWNETRVNPASINATQVITQMQQDMLTTPYHNLSAADCFARYTDYFGPQGNVVVLVKNESAQAGPVDDSLLLYVTVIPRYDDWAKNLWALGNGTGGFYVNQPSGKVTPWYLGPPRYEVRYCLAQPPAAEARICRFEYSPWIMVTVCTLNFFKALTMLCIWGMRLWQDQGRAQAEKQVIYTLGDAIASFMRVPDTAGDEIYLSTQDDMSTHAPSTHRQSLPSQSLPSQSLDVQSTKNMGLATKDDFLWRRTWSTYLLKKPPVLSREPRKYKKVSKRWFQAASWKRWVVLLTLCILMMLVSSILLAVSFPSLSNRNVDTSLSSLWEAGFGQLQPYTYLVINLPRTDPEGLIANVLIANLPQFLLSIIYIFYNSMLSTFLVQHEFSLMYKKRKALRVSEPVGLQRSSYFISLPLRYGIPLYLTSGIMHWLISQSLFLARITAVGSDGVYDPVNSFSTCGYSPIAIIITLLVGAVLIIGIIGLGLARKYDGTMPMVSTNSRAIAAACHAPVEDRENGWELPVKWAVVEAKNGVGRVAFTTAPDHDIELPKEGKYYL